MFTYILKRIVMTVIVLLMVLVFLSLLVQLVPGDAASALLGPRAKPATIEKVREAMDLDKPVFIQVFNFVVNILRADFGTDIFTRRSINDMIARALPNTLALAFGSIFLMLLIGIPMGVYSATHPNSLVDRLTAVISISIISVPSFVIGLLLLLIFSVRLKLIPSLGLGEPGDPLDYIRHMILPVAAMTLPWVGYLARLVRTTLLEVLNENYIRAARAFGIRQRLVYYKYALKNALIPTVAVLGYGMGSLMGGAVFIEIIFTRPGMGTLIQNAIVERNYPVVRAGVVVIAVLFILSNMIADFIYTYLDPRIQLGKEQA